MNEAVSMPTYKLIKTPLHPGLAVSTNLIGKTAKHHTNELDAMIAYYYHNLFGNSFLLSADYKFIRHFKPGIDLHCTVGLGYKHTILDRRTYQYHDGKFERSIDWGTPQVFLPAGIGIGYCLNEKYKAIAEYKTFISLPFNESMLFELHTLFSLGLQLTFNK